MKKNIFTIVGLMTIVMGFTSCGTFFSVGGSTAGYDDTYSYGGYNNNRLMSYDEARQGALYLSDKMAYELGLNSAQYDAAYEINLDYLLNLSNSSNLYGNYWSRRNSDLRYVLSVYQYDRYMDVNYFYRPVYWYDNRLSYYVYNRYNNPSYYYYTYPKSYSSYRGGRNRSEVSYYSKRSFGGRANGAVIQRNTNPNSNYPYTRGNNNSQNNRSFGGRSTGYNQNGSNMPNSSGNNRSQGYAPSRTNGNTNNESTFGGRSTNTNPSVNRQNSDNNRNGNNESQGYAPPRVNNNGNNQPAFGGRSTGTSPSVGRPTRTTTQPSAPVAPTRQSPASTSTTTDKVSGGHR